MKSATLKYNPFTFTDSIYLFQETGNIQRQGVCRIIDRGTKLALMPILCVCEKLDC